jgi:hypothetical protein
MNKPAQIFISLMALFAGSLAYGRAPLALHFEMQAAPLGVEEVRPQLSWQIPWSCTDAWQTPYQLVMVENPELKKIMTEKSKPIAPMALECEDMVNPVIEMQEPQLSWKLSDNRHGAVQTAYQILVSSTIENLAEGEGDLWNSGKQNSDQSILVTYKGKLLKSRQRVYWKVRYWDQNGDISPYSETASWRMGLLSEADWQAHWITSPQMKESASPVDSFLKAACSSPNTKNLFAERKPSIYFRKEFVIKGKIQDAIVRICGLGAFNLYVNGKKVGDAFLDPIQSDYDKLAYYRKFIDDIRQAYHENGLLGEIAGGKRKYGPPAMLDYMVATLIIPWSHYQYSGDRRELERHYEFMKRFAEASYPIIMERYQTGNLKLTRKERFFFGDWGDVTADGSRPPNEYILFPAETPAMLTGTQSIIYGLHCLSGTAAVLGKKEDQKHFSGMADDLVKMVNQFYFDESLATYGSQCANAWAHFLNMVPGESAKRFQVRFGEEIKTVDRNKLTAGQIGLGRIFQELTETGNGELVQILKAMETDHGFKCMLDWGATTLWEFQCQGIPVPSGSLNHPAFSGYDAWFYNYLGGIRPLAEFAGFKKFLLKPYFAPWIDWIDVTYESPYGIICSEWKKSKEKTVTWKVTIPPNTSALVYLPVTDPEKVTESDRPVSASSSIRLSERESGRVGYEVQSGKYEFNFLIE